LNSVVWSPKAVIVWMERNEAMSTPDDPLDSERDKQVEFTLFRSKDGQVVLMGKWWWEGEGTWLIHLTPKGARQPVTE
jgi:hypothetical protein